MSISRIRQAQTSRGAARTYDLGQLIIGEFSRYRVEAMLTRFGTIEYFVRDAESKDSDGLDRTVGQDDDLGRLVGKFGEACDMGRAADFLMQVLKRKERLDARS